MVGLKTRSQRYRRCQGNNESTGVRCNDVARSVVHLDLDATVGLHRLESGWPMLVGASRSALKEEEVPTLLRDTLTVHAPSCRRSWREAYGRVRER